MHVSSSDDFNFLLKSAFQNILSGTLSEFQTVWIQIRTDVKSVLIWVQTVYQGYQQTVDYVFVYYIHLLVTRLVVICNYGVSHFFYENEKQSFWTIIINCLLLLVLFQNL